MTDDLLPYYDRELAFVRRLGAQFADLHPKIAGRLRLGAEVVEDPHVGRLIESFAYLNARIRHKIEDDFPEITDALLNVLYPHYINPIPSMAIVHFGLDRTQAGLVGGYSIPRHTALETEPVDGEPCRFRTCYPVQLWPIETDIATLQAVPFEAPLSPRSADAVAVLRIRLKSLSSEVKFGQFKADSFRFFLKGLPQHVLPLYELIFNNCLGVAVASSPSEKAPAILPPSCLKPVGFAPDEGMLPYPDRSFLGYRLLSEYFAFPDKFQFVDVTGITPEMVSAADDALEIFLYLDQSRATLEQNISADTFQLGCTPIVNLFRQRAEPIPLTQTATEYRVVPDARRPQATEVYSVDDVTATTADGGELDYVPFYSFKHGNDRQSQRHYWYSARRPANQGEGETVDHGTEVYMSFVDLDFQPDAAADSVIDVETICLNRDLPHRLPFGGGQPRLQLTTGGGPVKKIVCLTPPTPTLRPAFRHGLRWRLISHLALGYTSITGEEDGADVLREILKLYDYDDSAETRALIESVTAVTHRRVTRRISAGGSNGVCRGVEVTINFDESHISGAGLFLFATILEQFLGLYTSINSFTQLVAKTKQRQEVLRIWPPRSGSRLLL